MQISLSLAAKTSLKLQSKRLDFLIISSLLLLTIFNIDFGRAVCVSMSCTPVYDQSGVHMTVWSLHLWMSAETNYPVLQNQ